MLSNQSVADSFSEFFTVSETRLRQSLTSVLGAEVAPDATAEALAYGWEHWDRVRGLENPIGYLYKVGRSKGRRMRRRRILLPEVSSSEIPNIEPGLPRALGGLSERQRTAVMLVHCYQWTLAEVAEVLGISKSSVQTHLERGMDSLRRELGSDR